MEMAGAKASSLAELAEQFVQSTNSSFPGLFTGTATDAPDSSIQTCMRR